VSDTVRGFLLAAEAEGVEGQVFNLGTGQETSIRDLAKKIIGRIGKPVNIMLDPQRLRPEPSEVLRLLSDNSLARQRLSWQPEVTLEEGLDHTIAWIRDHLDLYRVGTYEF
jgi:dTDP-glucose 4,6-dehydratase